MRRMVMMMKWSSNSGWSRRWWMMVRIDEIEIDLGTRSIQILFTNSRLETGVVEIGQGLGERITWWPSDGGLVKIDQVGWQQRERWRQLWVRRFHIWTLGRFWWRVGRRLIVFTTRMRMSFLIDWHHISSITTIAGDQLDPSRGIEKMFLQHDDHPFFRKGFG